MLFAVGPIIFDLVANVREYTLEKEVDFARKDVVGARRPMEFTGLGTETISFTGSLFPEKLGGVGTLEALKVIMEGGFPQMVVRGDGKVYGFFVITKLEESGTFLGPAGAPRQIDMEITLERCDNVSATSVFANLMTLFG